MSWYLVGALFVIGLWGVIAEPNLIRKVVALSITNTAVIILFVYQAALSGDSAPILADSGVPVDPVPHALMLTAIVVGICVVALALVLVYRLYRLYGTLDLPEIERRVWGAGEDHGER
jgi:multicomponent Na+:H+ antiporter subunit C